MATKTELIRNLAQSFSSDFQEREKIKKMSDKELINVIKTNKIGTPLTQALLNQLGTNATQLQNGKVDMRSVHISLNGLTRLIRQTKWSISRGR